MQVGLRNRGAENRFHNSTTVLCCNEWQIDAELLKGLEAAIGIEPMNKGFADLSKLKLRSIME